MNWRFKVIRLALSAVLLTGAGWALAEPYLAVRTGNDCSACHVNPNGGGLRSSYGAYYGARELPASPGAMEHFDNGQLNDSLRLGTDLRFNLTQTTFEGDDTEDSRSFSTRSGQLYMAFQPKGTPVMLYLDQQLLPGGGRNREAYVQLQMGNHTLKAGNLMLPYGLRLEDDSAFVRQATGFNFDNNDRGVELGLNGDRWHVDLAVSNGSGSEGNDDENFQYLGRAEYLGDPWRVGASYVLNDAQAGERTSMGLFGGINLKGYVLLFEMSRIEDDTVMFIPGVAQEQEVTLLELNRELARGYNLKLTTEWLDPDTHIAENERTRHSVVLEVTPFASLQLRGGVRVGEDIPQRPTGNYTEGFVQLHWYY